MSVLPNVPFAFIAKFEELVQDFLGNGKRLRIPLAYLKRHKENGGLKLVDLFKRQMALKAQWVVTIKQSESWQEIVYPQLNQTLKDKIWKINLSCDDINYVVLDDSFWKQVYYAWCMYNYEKPKTRLEISSQVIWYNSFIRVDDRPLSIWRAWQSGLECVKDLFTPEGTIASYQQITHKYGPCLTWYQHIQIINAIPHEWKEILVSQGTTDYTHLYNIDKIAGTNKISHLVYSKLIWDDTDIERARIKWQNRLNITIDIEKFIKLFDNIYKVTINTKLRDFQYRLLHNLIVNNRHLFVWKLKDNDKCSFCKTEMEHTNHLFYLCPVVQNLWRDLQMYIAMKTDNAYGSLLVFSLENIIFNTVHPKPGHIVNMLVLITKQLVYRCRCLEMRPNIDLLINEIITIRKMEYIYAKQKEKLPKHFSKWCKLFIELNEQQENIQNNDIDEYLANIPTP